MRKRSNKPKKIWIKIFLITAATFTALLTLALFVQSFFYNQSYNMSRKSTFDLALHTLSQDLRREGSSAEEVSRILREYRDRYGIWGAFFSADKITEKYARSELSGYEYSEDFVEAIGYYKESLSAIMQGPSGSNAYGSGAQVINGNLYDLLAIDLFHNGEVFFAIGLSRDEGTPSLVDQYFVYILLAGVSVSFLLSYLISVTFSRPLIKLNTAAKKMAQLDFSDKITVRSEDELGQLSASLNALSEKLDGTLGELTAANARLAQDIEKERNLEKTRKEFIANVSHELKTPLAIIKGYSEAIKDNIRTDKKEHYIARIVQEADDMNKLVQDMLDLTHIEAGRYKLQKTDFDLVMLAAHSIQSLQLLAAEKNLRMRTDFSKPAVFIYADRIKIGQVVLNFIHNAIRHTPENGVIRISVLETDAFVRLDVENEGNPIDPEKLDKVWERFYREKEDRNKKTGGSGLGLAIAATILTLHGMKYAAVNTERGVLFYFEQDI